MFVLGDSSEILSNFMTPHDTTKIPGRRNMSTDRKTYSHHKRIPIFSDIKNRSTTRPITMTSMSMTNNYVPFFEDKKVIVYDNCGCESKTVPCQIIAECFLRSVRLQDMKECYLEEVQKMEKRQHSVDVDYKRKLFKILPKWYPELFHSQLNNLVQVIELQRIGPAQFQCLAAIQYHTKIEYLTYFLFTDMKKSYSNKEKFNTDLQKELHKQNTSLRKLRFYYNQQTLADSLQKFMNEYYDSIGANLVPYQYYAKFMTQVYQKGARYFIKFLVNFMVKRELQLQRGLKMLRINELDLYRNYMREFNFEQFIAEP